MIQTKKRLLFFIVCVGWGLPLTNADSSEPRPQGSGLNNQTPATGAGANRTEKSKDDVAEISLGFQNQAIEIKFNLAKDWHFYADEKTAPGGTNLKITAEAKGLTFAKPVFPEGQLYFDKITNTKLSVYSDNFSVFVPFITDVNSQSSEVKVVIDGAVCNSQLCRMVHYELSPKIAFNVAVPATAKQINEPPVKPGAKYILLLAILAGLILNVMPCVWPVLPIIVLRLVSQSQKSRAKSIILGFAFALGIILFFTVLAAVSVILKLGFGVIFQWGDQFRNTSFVIAMALLMIVLALYMFGLFTFGLPASVSSSKEQKTGFAATVGMGFFAAVLSTPCSFAILTFVIAWAQSQPIPLATITILLIGAGMALPYVLLTCLPGLLGAIPKPGRWMELFKHATGFILLGIGVKLLEAIQPEKIINVLYYAVVLAVCVWMWGVWVQYNTPKTKKLLIRLAAIALAVYFGFVFLAEPEKGLINWQPYDAEIIAAAQKENQPVLIDFGADWCLSCKVLDKTVYSNAEVADLIKRKGVLVIKADTTRYDEPAAAALREIYNEPAVPVTVLLLPGKDAPIKLRGNLIKNELIKNLQSLKEVKE